MKFIAVPPPAHLADYIRFYWVYELDIPPGTPYVYRSMADGCAEMIFHYKGIFKDLGQFYNGKSRALVQAQSCEHKRFLTHQSFGIFGVYLYPFALPRLFNMPAAELSNYMPDLETLLGQEGVDLEEQMMLAPDNTYRMHIITAFFEKLLLKNYEKPALIHKSIKHVIHSPGITVQQLADMFCLSKRQFERKFRELSGFSPKLYSRIIRFQEALKSYGNKDRSLAEIAHLCGYYDQSHFIHDFKEFSGYHPSQYFHGRPEGVEYRGV